MEDKNTYSYSAAVLSETTRTITKQKFRQKNIQRLEYKMMHFHKIKSISISDKQ